MPPMFGWLWRLLVRVWRLVIVAVKGSPAQVDELLDMRRIIAGMTPITVMGFILTLVLCGEYWARGAMWCLSCLSIGAAVGFLFGIPKVLQGDGKILSGTAAAYRQRVNTNLEEISDWLTIMAVLLK